MKINQERLTEALKKSRKGSGIRIKYITLLTVAKLVKNIPKLDYYTLYSEFEELGMFGKTDTFQESTYE